MMLIYIVQIFSFCAMIISTLCKEKKNILIWVFIANFSNFLIMLIAHKTDGWMGSMATTLRALLFLNKNKVKTNIILYIGVLLHFIAFILSYQDIFSFCILFATLSVCISQWYGNAFQIKVFALVSVIFWCIYTIHIGLYLDLPKRVVEGVFLIVTMSKMIIKNRKDNLIVRING